MKLPCLFIVLCFLSLNLFSQDNKVDFTFNHVALAVKDLDKSAGFYMKILYLKEINNGTQNTERRWFSLGEDKELHLILNDSDVQTNMSIHMALNTPDFDTFLENVKNSDIPYFDWSGAPEKVSIRADGIKQIYLQDPDGYWIEINSTGSKKSN
jgi:lactoylglutathione lyase